MEDNVLYLEVKDVFAEGVDKVRLFILLLAQRKVALDNWSS